MGEQNSIAKEIILNFLSKKSIETPEEYDFKLEMKDYYETLDRKKRTQGKYGDLIKEIDEQINNKEKSCVNRWFAYKTLGGGYDCDSCEIIRAIYHCLWGWEMEQESSFRNSLLFHENLCDGAGGDTMNSLGTTMEKYVGKRGVKKCKEQWESENREDRAKKIGLEEFAKLTSCIGNFVLVPSGFNRYRGIHSCIKDYWDLSLGYLAYEGKSAWLSICNDSIEQKAARENKAFVKYINMFFLWDYVKEKYEVRPLFGSHKEKIGAKPLSSTDVYPKDEEEFRKYFENVNNYIKRRGLFMAAMLKIAVKYDEREEQLGQDGNDIWHVSDIYKYIVEKVFLTDKTYSGYKEVIETIKETIEKTVKDGVISTKIKDDIFDNILVNIEKLKEDTHDPKGND